MRLKADRQKKTQLFWQQKKLEFGYERGVLELSKMQNVPSF